MPKLTKQEAAYRPAEDQRKCAGCANYLPPDACREIIGVVTPEDVCNVFTPAGNADATADELLLPPPAPGEGII